MPAWFLAGQVAPDELFSLSDQALLIVIGPLLYFALLFALDQIVRVVSGVTRRPPIFDFDNPATGAVEKVTIVADDYKGRRVRLQKLFQPFDRADIEMIRGLIEQQHVRFREQQTRKTQTILLAAGKLFSFHLPRFAIEAQALQDRFGFGGIFKAAFAFVLVLQIAVARQDFFQIIAGVSHAMLKHVHLVFDLLQPAKRRQRRFVYGRTRFEVNVLGQQPEFHSTRARLRRYPASLPASPAER